MKKIGIGIDYSNICKDYNTVYLDRDNDDRPTLQCMKKIMDWISTFLSELQETFNYNIYRTTDNTPLKIEEIARKRFLFYSLEKEMLLQSFILQNEHTTYNTLGEWGKDTQESLLIKNDEEGEGLYFYCNENSKLHHWILEKLPEFSLEDVPFAEK